MTQLRTIIAIDQGTTSSRAILFNDTGEILAQQSAEFHNISLLMAGSSMILKIFGRQHLMSLSQWLPRHGGAEVFR